MIYLSTGCGNEPFYRFFKKNGTWYVLPPATDTLFGECAAAEEDEEFEDVGGYVLSSSEVTHMSKRSIEYSGIPFPLLIVLVEL